MPTSMKIPTVSQPASGRPVPPPAEAGGPGPAYSYTFGRLRPRLVDEGSWYELASLVPDSPLPPPDSDDFERLLVRLFSPDADGSLPSSFFLARQLVWPMVDPFGVPQCVVQPASDEEITELLAALQPPANGCSTTCWTIVHGTFAGHATDLPASLAGLPRVGLISVFPFDHQAGLGSGCEDDGARLFRAYQPILANNGIGDELRTVNFVLTRSKAFYELASRLDERGQGEGKSSRLVAMQAVPVQAPRSKPQVEVVFSFQNTVGGAVRRWSQRVDVGGPFMFLVTDEVQPFYGRPLGIVQPQGLRGVEPQEEPSGWPQPEASEALLAGPTEPDRRVEVGAGPGPAEVVSGPAVTESSLDEARGPDASAADASAAEPHPSPAPGVDGVEPATSAG